VCIRIEYICKITEELNKAKFNFEPGIRGKNAYVELLGQCSVCRLRLTIVSLSASYEYIFSSRSLNCVIFKN